MKLSLASSRTRAMSENVISPPVLGEVLMDQASVLDVVRRLQPFPTAGLARTRARRPSIDLLRQSHRAVDLGCHPRGLCGEISVWSSTQAAQRTSPAADVPASNCSSHRRGRRTSR